MIHELRIYHCLPQRLPALLARFERDTLRIWQRHGIVQGGFWTVLVGESNHDLIYLLAWQAMAEREQKWSAFQADPEWIACRRHSEGSHARAHRLRTARRDREIGTCQHQT